jgi:hypothetical protein
LLSLNFADDSGCSVKSESMRVVWSVSPAWDSEAVELTLGDRIHLPVHHCGPSPSQVDSDSDPTDLGATIVTVVAPGQMPCNCLPSSDADYLPF